MWVGEKCDLISKSGNHTINFDVKFVFLLVRSKQMGGTFFFFFLFLVLRIGCSTSHQINIAPVSGEWIVCRSLRVYVPERVLEYNGNILFLAKFCFEKVG